MSNSCYNLEEYYQLLSEDDCYGLLNQQSNDNFYNDGSQIWAGDKEQILQDIEDNYSYELADELKREQEYYEDLEDGIISL